MKISELKELMEVIEKSSIDVLKIEKQDFKLYYQKQNATNVTNDFGEQNAQAVRFDATNETLMEVDHTSNKENNGFYQIKSPMIGAFYARSNPDTDPFVQIGSVIEKNQTVCILEAMKLVNEVVSEVDGEIIEILVEDGQIIEFGQPLFVVKVNG